MQKAFSFYRGLHQYRSILLISVGIIIIVTLFVYYENLNKNKILVEDTDLSCDRCWLSSDELEGNFKIHIDTIRKFDYSTIDSVKDALNSWSHNNPNMIFEYVDDGDQDVTIRFTYYYSIDDLGRIHPNVLYAENNNPIINITMDDDFNIMGDRIAHSFGHYLGLEHHSCPYRVMFKSEVYGTSMDNYDTLGYVIPNKTSYVSIGYDRC